jgi:hypothetical protein
VEKAKTGVGKRGPDTTNVARGPDTTNVYTCTEVQNGDLHLFTLKLQEA